LQEAVRLDLDECMQAVTDIWRTTNQHVVAKTRKKFGLRSVVEWPKDFVLHRGGRLPEEHVKWFHDASSAGTIYRTKMATSTTKISDNARKFMGAFGYPKHDHKVHWMFQVDPDEKCVHVNCLEGMTHVPDEQEFLFPPYSAFKITSVEWKGDHYLIVAQVMPDNLSHDFDGAVPRNARLAPWS